MSGEAEGEEQGLRMGIGEAGDADADGLLPLDLSGDVGEVASLEINKSNAGPSPSEDVLEKMFSFCRQNLRIRFHVLSDGMVAVLLL